MVVHHYNPNTWEAQAGRSELEAGLIYRVNSRTGQTGLHRETLSQSQEKKKEKKRKRKKEMLSLVCLFTEHSKLACSSSEGYIVSRD